MNIIEKSFDVVVVGSGGAGGAAASEAARKGARVLVVSKDPLVCTDSKISEGIVTVRETGSPDDTERNLATNMRIEGGDLGDPELIQAFAKDSVHAYNWLRRWGQRSNVNPETGGPVSFSLGGHNKPRSVPHPQGGLDYGHSLWNALLQSANDITCVEDAWCLDVITSNPESQPEILGCLIYHAATGDLWLVRTPAVILASGGLSTLYFPHTDCMRGNTGDGFAIALRAGCQLVDMEQIQFIPFALVGPKSFQGLIVGEPASAGPLGVLRDKDGKIFLDGIMRRNRAEVAAAIALTVKAGRGTERGGCYLDLTQNVQGQYGAMYYKLFGTVGHAFVRIMQNAVGPKAATMQEPWEIAPSAHYCMGGVRVTLNGETTGTGSVRGLFAAGQVLGGLHGGNRLGSTSLTEAIIFGLRTGSEAADLAKTRLNIETDDADLTWRNASQPLVDHYLGLEGQQGSRNASDVLIKLQQLAWKYLGPVRTGTDLAQCWTELQNIRTQLPDIRIEKTVRWNQSLIDYIELVNLLTMAECINRSAQERPESIGAHVRLDAPRSKFYERRPYSVIVRGHHDSMKIERLPRQPTPLFTALRQRLKKKLFLRVLTWLRTQPQHKLDKILIPQIQKAARSAGLGLESMEKSANADTGHSLRLIERIPQTSDTVTFRFKPENNVPIDFLPGQFGNFVFDIDGQSVTRSYSFSSSPTTKTHLDITVKREPKGLVSNWMIDHLSLDQVIRMKGPQGHFTIPLHGAHRPPKKILLLGAGSGITPLISIAEWVADTQADVDVILINSIRTSEQMILSQELKSLPNRHAKLQTYFTVTGMAEPPTDLDLARTSLGRISTEIIKHWVPDLTDRHVYICGPATFMDNARDIVTQLGLARRKLHMESFAGVVDFSMFAGLESFRIEFTRSGKTTNSIPGESLLQLAEKEQLDASYSCRSGTCGECKTRLVSGQVQMLNDEGLSAAEKLNGHILTCTAVPLSDCQLEA